MSRFGFLFRCVFLSCFTASISITAADVSANNENSVRLAEEVRERLILEFAGESDQPPLLSRPAHMDVISDVMAERDYRPVWIGEQGAGAKTRELLRGLERAKREGLRPEAYAIQEIGDLIDSANVEDLARLELLSSRELLRYAADVRGGRVLPTVVDPEPAGQRKDIDEEVVLLGAIRSTSIESYVRRLVPGNAEYHRLRRALAKYHGIAEAGGWPVLPTGPNLRRGDLNSNVAILRARLEASGDLTVASDDPAYFDAGLDLAVRRFQARFGLDSDGIVGPATRRQLNVPVRTRIRQIEVNMERWRWMPDDLGERHIIVNLAGFEVDVVESGSIVMSMRAVVGRPYRRTPVFTGSMTYLEINPTWTIPPGILRNDILPRVREDPGYLARQKMHVYSGWTADARRLDPAEIDWDSLDPRRVPYRIVQQPGPWNALGTVKFMFPNRYHVYLHDTPERELFDRTVRTFSSGCIRVEKPMELTRYLLGDQPEWTDERIERTFASARITRVNLKRLVPVHLTYSTVWTGEGGTVHFREDIYDRDVLLEQALTTAEASRLAFARN